MRPGAIARDAHTTTARHTGSARQGRWSGKPSRSSARGATEQTVTAGKQSPQRPATTRSDYLRCRIFERMRRFLRPILRRPFPVFFVPTHHLHI